MRIGKFEIDLSSYLWVLPFISGLIAVISIITPAGYLEGGYYYSSEPYIALKFWMWGMWVNSAVESLYPIYYITSRTIFLKGTYFVSGIISSIIILSASIIVMMDALRVHRKKSSIENRRIFWSWCGILIWVATILWMIQISFASYYDIMVELGVWYGQSPPSTDLFTTPFWFYFKMDFGVIGPFITGGLLLFTRILTKR
ncbi:MAG: hypothetical protein ACFFBH_04580 [Promethearchaeota archaeon]